MSGAGWPWQVRTARLDLRAITLADVTAVHRIMADPRHCAYMPGDLQESPEVTRDWIERRAARWEDDGLGYWTARLRRTGVVIGVGGAERRPRFWNLYYLLDQAHWGHGYGTELAGAGQRTAAELDPELPLVAWIHVGNVASQAVARHLGLTDYGLREAGHWNGEPMHYWADRAPAPGS